MNLISIERLAELRIELQELREFKKQTIKQVGCERCSHDSSCNLSGLLGWLRAEYPEMKG